MRLGDLDALKDIEYINKGNFNTVEGIREWIDNAPTVEEVSVIEFKEPLPLVKAQKIVKALSKRPQGEWIPVRERLPEEIINPVTNDFYEYICTFHLDDVDDVRVYKFGNGHWWLCGQMMDKYVTAWMQRPEPYTEKNITNFYTKRFNEVN